MNGHIHLSFPEEVDPSSFDDFVMAVSADDLDLQLAPRPFGGPYAGIELLLPAAFVVYVTKAYFDGFLGKAGEDHYAALVRGLALLRDKLAGIQTSVVGPPGKADPDQPFSLTYAVMAEAGEGYTFKFLFRKSLEPRLRGRELECFTSLLAQLHNGKLEEQTIERLGGVRVIGRTILLAYDSEADWIVGVDPVQ